MHSDFYNSFIMYGIMTEEFVKSESTRPQVEAIQIHG